MERKYLLIIGIVAIMLVLGIIGKTAGAFSLVSGADGSTYSCSGKFYTSPAYNLAYFQDVADKCMDAQDVVCDAFEWSSTENGFSCQQICYMCEGDTAFIYAENMCSGDGIPLTGDEMIAYFIDDTLSDNDISQLYCAPPPPPPDMVTCYQCDGYDVDSKTFEDYCGSGWSLSRPSCGAPPPQTITCYSCNPSTQQLITQTIIGTSCPNLQSETIMNCNIDTISCYQCDGDTTLTNEFAGTVCAAGWNEYSNEVPKCGGLISWFNEYIDFENKPVESGLLIVAVLVLLYVLVITAKDLSGKGKSGRGGF